MRLLSPVSACRSVAAKASWNRRDALESHLMPTSSKTSCARDAISVTISDCSAALPAVGRAADCGSILERGGVHGSSDCSSDRSDRTPGLAGVRSLAPIVMTGTRDPGWKSTTGGSRLVGTSAGRSVRISCRASTVQCRQGVWESQG